MEQSIEKEVRLAHVSIQLSTVHWEGVEETPPYTGYHLSQRLSGNHAPLRIGNLSAPAVLPRVHSVGLLPPGRSIRLLPTEKPLRVLYCEFESRHFEQASQISQDKWIEHIGSLVTIKNKRLEILMQEIYAEVDQPGFGHEALIDAASTMILIELARYLRTLDGKQPGHGGSSNLSPWQLRSILDRIETSPDMGYPRLQELAELCAISESHLMRSFKAATGWQIHKYITEEKFQAAKTMLTAENLSCEEIALRLGFKSPAYFSTAFRRITGKTPTEYRKVARTRASSV